MARMQIAKRFCEGHVVMNKEGTTLTASDIALNVVSVVLAFFSASFAGYMVMYGPPERTGNIPMVSVALEPFDTSRTKLGQYDTLDPIVTGSITKDARIRQERQHAPHLSFFRRISISTINCAPLFRTPRSLIFQMTGRLSPCQWKWGC